MAKPLPEKREWSKLVFTSEERNEQEIQPASKEILLTA